MPLSDFLAKRSENSKKKTYSKSMYASRLHRHTHTHISGDYALCNITWKMSTCSAVAENHKIYFEAAKKTIKLIFFIKMLETPTT